LTLFMGMVFLDERLTAGQWAASALVFGGVILSQWKTAQSEEKADSSATASLSEGAE
jgi:drug/metabolite transporter (DMT)-like permease